MCTRRSAWPVALALAAAALACSAGLWLAAPVGQAAGSERPTLVLDGQNEWVTPSSTSAAPTFDLELSARAAPAGARIAVTLYPRLDARDHFEDVVQHGPRDTPLSEASPVAIAQLPSDAHTPGGVDLDLQVVTSQSTGGGERLGLACSGPTLTGTCTGVYPVTVALTDASGAVLHRFTTFLTYSSGKSATPLDFAWVLPISSPVSVATHARSPASALAPLARSEATALEETIAAIHAAPSVPVTVDASPETLQALDAAGLAGRSAVTTLAALSADQSVDEVPAAPYVPIDAASLAGAGESTELYAQMVAGETELHELRIQTAPALEWVAAAPVGDDLASGLSRLGAADVVVPDTSLAPTPSAPPETWASTFQLALGSGSRTVVDAAETDEFLDGQFRDVGADPALSAAQILADLAMVHYERPYTAAVRGMVAVPPSGWTPNAAFVRALLAGLNGNPVVTAVTLGHFFAAVTPAGTRTLKSGSAEPALRRSVARSVSAARVRLSEFDETVLGKPRVLGQLDHVLLAAESDLLTDRRQVGALAEFTRLLTDQLHLVSFASERTYTLTARTGVIPITVESRAPYTVLGTLVVSGAKFTFAGRATQATHVMKLDHATNPWRVSVTARTSGDLPLYVAFTSRSGRLVIAEGRLEVRSTATSLVGIVLTALALAVLLAWWARTWRNRRRGRRQAPEPVEQPEHVGANAS